MLHEIAISVPLGTVLVLTGPGGGGGGPGAHRPAVCAACVEPFGGDVLVSRDVLWTTQPVAGWRVPWGRYEVLGAPPGSPPDWTFKPTDFFGYLAAYAAGSPEADLTGTAVPGVLGYGAPDGRISTDDFFYFLSLYSL